MYGTPTPAPPSGKTADIASVEVDGVSEAADGPAPEAAATAVSTNAEADDAGKAADGVAAEGAATAPSMPLQPVECNYDDDDGNDAPECT